MSTRISIFFVLSIAFCHVAYSQCTVQGIEITAFLADPNGGTNNFDTDGDGVARDDDEFVQICNTTGANVTLTGFRLDDLIGTRYAFTSGDVIPANACINIISDWRNTITPLPRTFRDMNGGAVWNNTGDSIILTDGVDSCVVDYFSRNTPKQSGCPTVVQSGVGAVDCTLSPSDLTHNPLPIQLTYLSASRVDADVHIDWITSLEVNNDYFTIESSMDGKHFTAVADVVGAGTSTAINEYSFIDKVAADNHYYRLKQTDFDGYVSFSKVVKVVGVKSQLVIQNYSNRLIVKNAEGEKITYLLSDINGVIISSSYTTSDLTIEKSILKPGVYILQIESSFGKRVVRLRTI